MKTGNVLIAGVLWCLTSGITPLPSEMGPSNSLQKIIKKFNPASIQVIDYFLKQAIRDIAPSDTNSEFTFENDKRNIRASESLSDNSGDGFVEPFQFSSQSELNEKIRQQLIMLLKKSEIEIPVREEKLHWRQKHLPRQPCKSIDGSDQYHCPTPDPDTNEWSCIADYQLCDGMSHCPNNEDEDKTSCLFYQAMKSDVQILGQNVEWFNQSVKRLNKRITSLRTSATRQYSK